MSRELRRVPMGFDWPLHKVWDGFLNPHYKVCPTCQGEFYTPARKMLDRAVQNLLWAQELRTDPQLRELTGGLSGRAPRLDMFGHDGSDVWCAIKAIIKAAGLDPDVWGICPTCRGDGIDPAVKEKYEAWQPTEPPPGAGYQLWENCSEGSPVSPVFVTLDELCAWCEDNATTFGSYKTSAENWKTMLEANNVHHQQGNFIFI
jgi:hypothetical protein